MTSQENYPVFRECLSSAIVARSEHKPKINRRKQKARRNGRKDVETETAVSAPERADPEELAEFIDFLASETFLSFPADLQNLSYAATQHDPTLAARYIPADADTPLDRAVIETLSSTVPVSISDSLAVYSLIPDASDLPEFLSPILTEYVTSVTAGPPAWASTRTEACEICERDWIPLSYHHLIPRGVHAKVVKKGWHDEWMLNSVAWLCRACHSFVHRMATNEELAREWFTIDRILEREDVRDWAKWVGRVRWKAR
ncbi:hypothetical protein NUU61_009035 [Penicillium alfredii]|uniref:HNH domain-containing protein n=1 Tax=Penicillium alfredii TaxID=1506179 RepID=A0A9W9EMD9_9EURO|nr:uncharacterized protein NUU61_009035 [Penicillium alfredii]KAJ5084456.1 hypothetical protein NUU61_009035 [Penicillium alfredii]